ncbi:MAG: hypothetical protein AAB426_11560 [Myxococcota bacterium]
MTTTRSGAAGCTVRTPSTDMFWGDRYSQVIDPFGHTWGLATHTEDVDPNEMQTRHAAFVAEMAKEHHRSCCLKLSARLRSPVRSSPSSHACGSNG